MKYLIFLSLCLSAFIMANPMQQQTNNGQHTFLVKTDLTKEQVQNLLNEYHRNRNHTAHFGETTTLHQNETHLFHPNEHQNETTELKVKKQKKIKEPKIEQKQETNTKIPQELPEVKSEVVEIPEPQEAPEAPEAPEQPEAPETPEAPEEPEVENETTNLKKKSQKQKTQKNQHQHGIKETNATEPIETEIQPENKTELKKKSETHGNTTELLSTPCANETTNLMSKNETKVKQSNSLVYVVFSSLFALIVFVSLFVFITNPKGQKKINETFRELTDYLLVKNDQRKKYDLRDF
jgi:hypothetical protein